MENFLLCGDIQVSNEDSLLSQLSCNGTVYKGRRRGTIEFVGIWKHNKTDKKYIENGVQLMYALAHENVLKFHEWYETPQHIWVITELAIGGSLEQILEQDGFISDINSFVTDIIAGLQYLHSKGIIYCDLQPAKIVLDGCQLLKLSDFTLAKPATIPSNTYDFSSILHTILTKKDPPLTAVGYAPSPFYAAPELYDGANFSLQSDLWSLGCVVHELRTGCKAFDGEDPSKLIECIKSVQIGSEIQCPETAQLVDNLLTRDPSKRRIVNIINNT